MIYVFNRKYRNEIHVFRVFYRNRINMIFNSVNNVKTIFFLIQRTDLYFIRVTLFSGLKLHLVKYFRTDHFQ